MANFILNKGGAGVSISRAETVERINPIIRRLSELNHRYAAATSKLAHEEISEELKRHLNKSRVDVAKLSETVLSAGGRPYNATDLEPENYVAEGADDEILSALREEEQQFLDLVNEESRVDHQIRTQAILLNVRTDSQERLNYLKQKG